MRSFGLSILLALVCVAHAANEDLAMKHIVAEQVTHPREDIGSCSTFYRIVRASVVIDVCAADLVAALEKHHAENPHITDDTELAAELRRAISSSIRTIQESELPRKLSDRALYQLADVFLAGGYRIIKGDEPGSCLVVGDWGFVGPEIGGLTSACGGKVFFWSQSRRPIFVVGYWMT